MSLVVKHHDNVTQSYSIAMTIFKADGKRGCWLDINWLRSRLGIGCSGHPCCPIMKGGKFSNGLTTIKSLLFLYGNSTVGISALA